jgi:hypothetical protein
MVRLEGECRLEGTEEAAQDRSRIFGEAKVNRRFRTSRLVLLATVLVAVCSCQLGCSGKTVSSAASASSSATPTMTIPPTPWWRSYTIQQSESASLTSDAEQACSKSDLASVYRFLVQGLRRKDSALVDVQSLSPRSKVETVTCVYVLPDRIPATGSILAALHVFEYASVLREPGGDLESGIVFAGAKPGHWVADGWGEGGSAPDPVVVIDGMDILWKSFGRRPFEYRVVTAVGGDWVLGSQAGKEFGVYLGETGDDDAEGNRLIMSSAPGHALRGGGVYTLDQMRVVMAALVARGE